MKKSLTILALFAAMSSAAWANNNDSTTEIVKQRGKVSCLINSDVAGLATPGPTKTARHTGMAVDFCKAIAAAILNDPEKIELLPVIARDQVGNLVGKNGDVLIRTFPDNLFRQSKFPLVFVTDFYHDGQVFAVSKKLNIKKKEDLNGVTACIQQGALSEQGTATWFRKNNLKYNQVTFGDPNTLLSAFSQGRCDILTADKISVVSELNKLPNPQDYEILPFEIARNVYGIAVRKDDKLWEEQVKWITHALIYAEEFGITAANVRKLRETSEDPNIRKLLGKEGDFNKIVDLDPEWAVRAIEAVGNYGEIYDRHLGPKSLVKIDRGINKLCTDGGRLCPVPMN